MTRTALHLNDAFAEGIRFGRRIGHGTLVYSPATVLIDALPTTAE